MMRNSSTALARAPPEIFNEHMTDHANPQPQPQPQPQNLINHRNPSSQIKDQSHKAKK
jgi:hypothetical protein